ncbi:type II secretion system protein GspL [Pseudomonas xionganensis]|uniref:Type II secretion system protein L n=1 Tax=Pseudomonas xionganensis TaxID=2654845 RepID=A0A6I4L3S3_9PSED|nr:type II secretion system protein GspL [Pseudomonas xionganensis]MVW77266.1 type II secretion system protein GspL [Pseudomonas xionganensis]
MSHITVFLPPAACATVQAELPVQRVQEGHVEQLPFEQAVAATGADWTLVLPVEAVTACAVSLPTRKARWLRQALPFAVEELLAEEVELMHLALGESLADGRQRVFALRRSWLAAWLQLCPQAPSRIAVDADLLPGEGTQLLELHGRWLLGGAGAARLALDLDDWPALAASCPAPHRLLSPSGQTLGACEVQRIDEPCAWLASQALRNNLAQGEFAVRETTGQWQVWKPLAAVLGLWLLLQLGFNLGQGWYLQREADRYGAASEALYRELFPEDTRLVDIRAQFDQHLRQASGGGEAQLLGLLGQVSQALLSEGSVRIRQLDYSEQRGDLALQVQAPGFAELERLRERLQESGLAVQLGSASREAEGVSARVVIGG